MLSPNDLRKACEIPDDGSLGSLARQQLPLIADRIDAFLPAEQHRLYRHCLRCRYFQNFFESGPCGRNSILREEGENTYFFDPFLN